MSVREVGSYIGFNRVASTSQDSASGIWSLAAAERRRRAAAWPMPPFQPSSISGLQLWLDASAAETLYDATTGGSLVAADGTVKRWEDKSGNNRHATEASNGPQRKTAIQGGLDVLRFDGTDDKLSHSVIVSDPTELTVFFVGTASLANKWSHRSESTRVIQLNEDSGSANVRAQVRGSGNVLISPSVQRPAGTFFCSGFVFDKTSGNHFAFANTTKGTVVSNSFSGETFTATNNTIAATTTDGGTTFTSFFDGDIAEIIIYDSALSDTDREAVENYLMAKWAIT